MLRALVLLALSAFIFSVMPGWNANVNDAVTTNGLGSIIQGLYHGFMFPWSVLSVYAAEYVPLLTYDGACIFEPAYKGNFAYLIGFIAGGIGMIGSVWRCITGD